MTDLKNRTSFARSVIVAISLIVLASCGWMETVGGRQIQIVFRNAGTVHAGAAVYVSGVEVGITRDTQAINGRATVPVQLYRRHKSSVAAGSVFLIENDPKHGGANCLTGYAAALSPDPSKENEVFFGASNRLELVGLIGIQKVTNLIGNLTK